ncbi:MAG: primosomal protein N', partial [Chloroflexaceae bacterium]|nr:primosomal protein N' [Chloroflexaceae bacterium]
GEEPAQAIIQTYAPEHPAIKAVQYHDYSRFVREELADRAQLGYPPYGSLILLRLSGLEEPLVQKTAESLAIAAPEMVGGEVLGPAPATIGRVARRYRWQVLLKFREEEIPPFSRIDSTERAMSGGSQLKLGHRSPDH